MDVAALLSSQPEPKGRRVAVLTNAGGLGILCADACDAAGLEVLELAEETRHELAQFLSPERVVEAALARGDDVWLEPAEARELLLAYRIPLVEERIAGDADEASAAARELGFPVVVKTAAAGAHKTELGGIALDLTDAGAVRAAVERIGAPVLVQPMVRGSAELLAGVVQDAVFGPLVAFGPGDVLAELIGEAAFRIGPLTDQDAEELVHGGKAGRLVLGFRGAPAADSAALVDLVHRLARLGEDLHAVAELDLNPVIAHAADCVVVDARVRVEHPQKVARTKTW